MVVAAWFAAVSRCPGGTVVRLDVGRVGWCGYVGWWFVSVVVRRVSDGRCSVVGATPRDFPNSRGAYPGSSRCVVVVVGSVVWLLVVCGSVLVHCL